MQIIDNYSTPGQAVHLLHQFHQVIVIEMMSKETAHGDMRRIGQ